ncbi:YbaB/EbfC family nucleoid-associated protein [Glycomyces buryatensis]|uniref:YbaB/EbfC family nucleoid-associated protein n=1 Tax=Glycomyces buryatensis TaxID=2570927 RepID=A0A4S8PWH7_9ACTN|nr:YbaB/EbfC family nucleoid-associated protein [Glycomyces buryatensis]THV34375.1 YbaB/EbfC family nucleoid-associated protein [Glycomyces buryatensis]
MDQHQVPDCGAIQRLVETAEAAASSEDGAVRVVTKAGGKITELDLHHTAFALSGVELGELIVETIQAAEANLDRELSAAIAAQTGVEVQPGSFGGGLRPVERAEEEQA